MLMLIRCCALVGAVLAIASPAGQAADRPVPGRPVSPPLEASQASPPEAVSTLVLAPRADLSIAAWNPATDSYALDYARPHRWTARLDSCGSRPGSNDAGSRLPITSRVWRLEPLDGQHDRPLVIVSHIPGGCATNIELPALGRWRLTLTVRDGTNEGTKTRTVSLRDHLVVALGDGYASGEGDGYASREGDTDYYDFDEQCHRSSNAWPAIVARRLENATTAVTFLSFACARAQLRHLYLSKYGGVEPDGLLDPQLVAARRAIGNPLDPATRQVDVLLVGAGRDDLGFNSALKACRLSIASDCRDGLSVLGLQESYEDLEVGISATMRVGRTVIADYPARIFTDGSDDHDTWACRSYEFMSDNEAEWITEWGQALNNTIASAATANGWRSVPTTDAFRGHGYCASIEEEMVRCDDIRVLEPDCAEWTTIQESYFVYAADEGRHVHQELKAQEGIINPTTDGHAAVAAQVLAGPLLGASAPQPQRLTVRLSRVRVTDLGYDPETGAEARPWDRKVDFTVDWQANVCGRATLKLENVLPGSWVDVSSNPCARYEVAAVGSRFKVRASTALGRFVFQDTEIDPGESSPPDLQRDRGYLVRRAHLRSSGFDASPALGRPTHRKLMRLRDSHDGGTLEIEYTVTYPADESDQAAQSAITAQ